MAALEGDGNATHKVIGISFNDRAVVMTFVGTRTFVTDPGHRLSIDELGIVACEHLTTVAGLISDADDFLHG